MNKTNLERLIRRKAEIRYDEELFKAKHFCKTNKILSILKIGEHKEVLFADYRGNDVMNLQDRTNIKEVKEIVINRYEEEETKNILDKIKTLGYLFENSE